jgi:hypothetical protein
MWQRMAGYLTMRTLFFRPDRLRHVHRQGGHEGGGLLMLTGIRRKCNLGKADVSEPPPQTDHGEI